MLAGYIVAKTSVMSLLLARHVSTIVFVGRLGITQREIWRLSSSSDPTCIARLPIQKRIWQSWQSLRIAVSPARDEIMVPSSVESRFDDERSVWHIVVNLTLLDFNGASRGKFRFDTWDPGRFGFGFTHDGHPWAASRSAADKIEIVMLDHSRLTEHASEARDLLEWRNLDPRWTELSRVAISNGITGMIPGVGMVRAVEIDNRSVHFQSGVNVPRPEGVSAWIYGSRYFRGVLLTGLDVGYHECDDWTRAMSIYLCSDGGMPIAKWFDGAYAVVARTGNDPVRLGE